MLSRRTAIGSVKESSVLGWSASVARQALSQAVRGILVALACTPLVSQVARSASCLGQVRFAPLQFCVGKASKPFCVVLSR